jgi:hypothetical protein
MAACLFAEMEAAFAVVAGRAGAPADDERPHVATPAHRGAAHVLRAG